MAEAKPDAAILAELLAVIERRRQGDPAVSYTARLFSKGRAHIAKKLGEEAVETVIAATGQGKPEQIAESADLLFHLLVLWADCGIKPEEVFAELAKRRGVSGIDEKKARPSQ
ncbi:MAG: phosphoribosyl-ATP diphosphatase [Alphaproteobacteria bacterium]